MKTSDIKLGILGGGQLGKMLLNATSKWNINTSVLDPTADCPASSLCNNFVQGSFRDFKTVYNFGKNLNILTIEIESVNTEALLKLKSEGLKIYPEPEIIEIIKDKSKQKKFYFDNEFPTSTFKIYENHTQIIEDYKNQKIKLPFVQKLCKEGYDGRGVLVVKTESDLNNLLQGETIVEEMIEIQKEISVIVARNTLGETKAYQAVEMIFNPKANLVEYLICPAELDEKISNKAKELALRLIEKLQMTGLLAVEMFIDKNNEILINEVAPRPHNSGHQTIECSLTSQYEQHLRAILGLPLGSTKLTSPSIMLNLLGEPGYEGTPIFKGMEECLALEGVNIHYYGKNYTKPYRKMGHVTIIDNNLENAKNKAKFVKENLKIIS